jgi:hypothetical protein
LQLAAAHREIISLKDEDQRAKGNLREDRFVRKTKMASLVEEFEREKVKLVDAAERALAENCMLREEASKMKKRGKKLRKEVPLPLSCS